MVISVLIKLFARSIELKELEKVYMRKFGKPEPHELVVCRIKKIYPNSVFAELIEYNLTGMIHVSEVAGRWVKNIREFLKEGQYVVCKVMWIEGDNISLSVKRVHKEQANRKLDEFKKERKAEKMLEFAGKKLKKDLDQSYREVGYKLQDHFGSLSKGFKIILKNPDLLKTKNIPSEWIKVLTEIAKKAYTEKTYEIKAKLKLICYKPDGIKVIKRVLTKAMAEGLEIKYISAPLYLLIGKGKNYKELESKINMVAEGIVKEINQNNGEASFIMEK